MFQLEWPLVLALLPLPLLAYWLLPANRTLRQAALRVPLIEDFRLGADSVEGITPRRWQQWLSLLAWVLLVLAASRPQWLGEAIALPVSGRDLMLAVDLSDSMRTGDFRIEGEQVNRLRATKVVASDFIERRRGDRLGLILFGTRAYLQTPLTFDRNTVKTLLMETPLGIAGGKTAIGDAIGLAVKRLQTRPAENRVLVLLTDGVNNVGEVEPAQAAKLAALEGIKIYTVGFGADEMIVPGFIFQRTVNPSAELDVETLTEIATQTGGLFQRARSADELAAIYRALDELEPIEQDQETYRPVRSLFWYPLGFALITSFVFCLLHPALITWAVASWATRPRIGRSASSTQAGSP